MEMHLTFTKLSLFTWAPIAIVAARIVNTDIQIDNQTLANKIPDIEYNCYKNVHNDPVSVALISLSKKRPL